MSHTKMYNSGDQLCLEFEPARESVIEVLIQSFDFHALSLEAYASLDFKGPKSYCIRRDDRNTSGCESHRQGHGRQNSKPRGRCCTPEQAARERVGCYANSLL